MTRVGLPMPEPFDPYRKWLGIPPKDQPPKANSSGLGTSARVIVETDKSAGSDRTIDRNPLDSETTPSDPAKVAGPVRPSPGQSTAPEKTDQRGSAPRNDRLTLGALLNGPEIKPPVPDQQDLAKAERQARDLYGDSLTNAKQLEQKQALAFTLFDKASENQANAAAQYVLLRMARDAGAEGGSAKIVVAAVEEMAKWYRVDARELKLEALAKAGKTAATPQLKQELVDAEHNGQPLTVPGEE